MTQQSRSWAHTLLFSRTVVSDCLQPQGLQHARPCCPSPSPGVCPSSCPLALVITPRQLIFWHPLLLPSIFPSIRDFASELAVHIKWPKYWSFSFSISSSSEYSGLISLKTDWFDLLACSAIFSSITVWRHQLFGNLPSLWSSSHNDTWPLGRP